MRISMLTSNGWFSSNRKSVTVYCAQRLTKFNYLTAKYAKHCVIEKSRSMFTGDERSATCQYCHLKALARLLQMLLRKVLQLDPLIPGMAIPHLLHSNCNEKEILLMDFLNSVIDLTM